MMVSIHASSINVFRYIRVLHCAHVTFPHAQEKSAMASQSEKQQLATGQFPAISLNFRMVHSLSTCGQSNSWRIGNMADHFFLFCTMASGGDSGGDTVVTVVRMDLPLRLPPLDMLIDMLICFWAWTCRQHKQDLFLTCDRMHSLGWTSQAAPPHHCPEPVPPPEQEQESWNGTEEKGGHRPVFPCSAQML